MPKRDQNTGLPKKVVKPQAAPETPEKKSLTDKLGITSSGEAKSRHEREQELQRLIIIGTGIALAVVIVILAISFVYNGLIRPNETVATVNGQNISGAQFTERVRLERAYINERLNTALNDFVEQTGIDVNQAAQFVLGQEPYATWYSEIQTADQLGIRVLEDMINEQLVRAEAAERGITVSDEDIENTINGILGYDPEAVAAIGTEPTATPEPTLTPTPFVTATPTIEPDFTPTPTLEATATPEVTAQPTATPQPTLSATEVVERYSDRRGTFLRNIASQAGVSEQRVLDYIAYIALEDKLADALNPETDQVVWADARHILVTTEEEAIAIIDALNAGENFADLARAKSQDTGSGQEGGELGLSSTLNYVEPFGKAIDAAEIGQTVGPVESDFGFHIIQVRSKELRDANDQEKNLMRTRALDTWIETEREAQAENFDTFGNWIDFNTDSPVFVYRPR